MSTQRKFLLSGLQPSGALHIGNYFGALKQFLDFQETHHSYIMIADLHALTTVHDKERFETLVHDLMIDYLAVGLDPEKVVLFRQSDVPYHTELMWIFSCLTTVPYLERGHAYKDKIAKGITPSMGLLAYPVLQAADILLYNPDVVPVGEDQRQHVEYARDIAEKFNHTFGETFKVPKGIIPEDVAVIPGTDGQKMSKSYGNTIPLFATLEEIQKAVMSIPTDSKGVDEPKNPEEDLVFMLHKLFAGNDLPDIRAGYEKGGLGYGESKKRLAGYIDTFVTPLREKREELVKDTSYVHDVFAQGAELARERAEEMMEVVRGKVGLE